MQKQSQPLVVDVLVPARNAAATIGQILQEIPSRLVRSVVVVDNDSTDATAQVALDRGAVVLRERRHGYGAACRRGIKHFESLPQPPDVVAFLAADGTDDPAELGALLAPVCDDNAELVVGVRARGRGSAARVGVQLIGALYRYRFSDIGPFRVIRFPALVALGLRDSGGGWHAEMQVKALKFGLQIVEVPVSHRASAKRSRFGRSQAKTSRTVFQILRHSTAR